MTDIAWAVQHWKGGLYIQTVRRTRAESIAAFEEVFGTEWADHRGPHKAVRVQVQVWRGH